MAPGSSGVWFGCLEGRHHRFVMATLLMEILDREFEWVACMFWVELEIMRVSCLVLRL